MKVAKSLWQKKTLSDFFDLQMGKTPSRKDLSLWADGYTPWVSISDMKDTRFISQAKESLSMETISQCRIPIIPIGTVIMSFKLTIGKTCIVAKPLVTNEAIMAFYPKEGVEVNSSFLAYALSALKWKGNRAVKGITINKKTISDKIFSLPPLNQQEAIASELDALQEVIDGYKAQIADLDALAQSIFLDIFGDPITNPKGWEIEKIKDVCDTQLGKMINQNIQTGESKPFLCAINVMDNDFNITEIKEFCIKKEEKEKFCVKKGDLMICEGGDAGRCAIWNKDFEMYYQKSVHRVRSSSMSMIYLMYVLRLFKVAGFLSEKSKGSTIQHLTQKTLNLIEITVPPIELQQQFASQVEAIEQQKELFRQQLADAEMLMAERMQYYFS